MMNKKNFLIYGSYGYTGRLIANLACQQGLKPVLGGRNNEKLVEQSKLLNLDYRVFDVNHFQETKEALKEFVAVIHCAGPFIKTYKNMIDACIESQTHYLDITGEYNVIETLAQMNMQAKDANIMILPGAGFDVVPSDCLAQHLKSRLTDANELTLAIHALSDPTSSALSVSRGTAKTMLEGLSSRTMIRDGGVLKEIPSGLKKRAFDFGDGRKTICLPISWGDLSSAWWSTQIPHIETYMSTPPKLAFIFKLINPIKSVFKWKPMQQFMLNKINSLAEGPTPEMRRRSSSQIFGEAKNSSGKKVGSLLKTPDGYDLTAMATLIIIKKVLSGNAPIGFQTPSTAYGKDLILEIPNVTREDVF